MPYPTLNGGGPAPAAAAPAGGGALPWNAGAGTISFGGSPAELSQQYANAYQSALNFNAANYNNVYGGYQNLLSNLATASAQNVQGYGNLSGSVLAGIDTVGQAASQNIANQYKQASGAAAQQLVSRGLGNTTVQQSVQRGIESQKSQADLNLADQLATMKAGYQSNIGLAQLGYQAQAAQQYAAAQQAQLNFMNSVTAQYPNASLYADLAQMFGMRQGQQAMVQQPGGSQNYVPGNLSWPTTPGMFSGSSGAYPGGGYGGGYNPALAPPSYAPPGGTPAPSLGGYYAAGYDQPAATGVGGYAKGLSGAEGNGLAGLVGSAAALGAGIGPLAYAGGEDEDYGFFEGE